MVQSNLQCKINNGIHIHNGPKHLVGLVTLRTQHFDLLQ